ncbi:MAG: hypothetical protein M1820_001613 [Bogoriella megaspora]|nr:MAG: hypothetical protein M1820_001613 [Bogoriella megaspora]
MRLLNTSSLQLHEFNSHDCLEYAILSHTWGSEEASFQDFALAADPAYRYDQGSGWQKIRATYRKVLAAEPANRLHQGSGWQKIRATCRKALTEGIDWVWIDTCCIDKASSAELSEAINSMFRWYEDSAVCYVYLDDFTRGSGDLAKSRWFWRGWTLQELLAPREVRIFDGQWNYLGSKNESLEEVKAGLKPGEMCEIISTITKIPTEMLAKLKSLRDYSVAQRMSWASRRETTRPEDVAYCLLGIFDVNMPLLYGEGARAFSRLQHSIIQDSHSIDHSILAWGPSVPELGSLEARREYYDTREATPGTFLASSPKDFFGAENIVAHPANSSHSYELIKAGLRIQLPLIGHLYPYRDRDRAIGKIMVQYALLRCHPVGESFNNIAIPLDIIDDNQGLTHAVRASGFYTEKRCDLDKLGFTSRSYQLPIRDILIMHSTNFHTQLQRRDPRDLGELKPSFAGFIIRVFPQSGFFSPKTAQLQLKRVYPRQRWKESTQTITIDLKNHGSFLPHLARRFILLFECVILKFGRPQSYQQMALRLSVDEFIDRCDCDLMCLGRRASADAFSNMELEQLLQSEDFPEGGIRVGPEGIMHHFCDTQDCGAHHEDQEIIQTHDSITVRIYDEGFGEQSHFSVDVIAFISDNPVYFKNRTILPYDVTITNQLHVD